MLKGLQREAALRKGIKQDYFCLLLHHGQTPLGFSLITIFEHFIWHWQSGLMVYKVIKATILLTNLYINSFVIQCTITGEEESLICILNSEMVRGWWLIYQKDKGVILYANFVHLESIGTDDFNNCWLWYQLGVRQLGKKVIIFYDPLQKCKQICLPPFIWSFSSPTGKYSKATFCFHSKQ